MTNKNPTAASVPPVHQTPETMPEGTDLAGPHVGQDAVQDAATQSDEQPGLTGTAARSAEDTSKRPKKKSTGNPPAPSGARAAADGAPKVAKSEAVLKLLRRRNGAALSELQDATGWQAHSVRGFLSGTVKKKLGLNLASEVGRQGVRRYRIITLADAS